MKRNNSINLLKVTAIFFVICVHFLLNTEYYSLAVDNNLMIFWVCLRCLFITCVPLFLITTGLLMNKKTLSGKYIVKIIPFIIKYVVISIIVWFFGKLFFSDSVTFSESIRGIFDYSTISYSWYVEMYLGLYFLIPLLNIVWSYNETIIYHVYIILLAFVLVFFPSFLNVFGKVIPDYWQFLYPISYYFFGCFFSTYKKSIEKISYSKIVQIFLIFLVCFTFINVNISWNREFQWTSSNDYYGYQPFFMSISLFFLIVRIKINKIFFPVLELISKSTICIYLISNLTDRITYQFVDGLFSNQKEILMYGPLIIIIDFIIAAFFGCTINSVLNKIIFKFRKDVKS